MIDFNKYRFFLRICSFIILLVFFIFTLKMCKFFAEDLYYTENHEKNLRDMPISNINSISTGLVKIKGEAKPYISTIKCPISNKDCVYYSWDIQEYDLNTRKDRYIWRDVKSGGSTNYFLTSFLIDDGTGHAVINFDSFSRIERYNLTSVTFNMSDAPKNIKEFIKEKYYGKEDGYLLKHKVRIIEYSIEQGESISVIGNISSQYTNLVIDGTKGQVLVFIK
ncbi:MAG: hypothetical protein AABX32_07600 [Nanoarchaeota archaeon]